ncbi:Pex19 protein family-domain-containing protein [Scheffersomyces xylosifermentans]|uniref:Pex19 protein family-domain-containing protein n=1 Tax=Scheffersomyces xylosifermentans TaxID=1304137 RepID=UPI00315DD546
MSDIKETIAQDKTPAPVEINCVETPSATATTTKSVDAVKPAEPVKATEPTEAKVAAPVVPSSKDDDLDDLDDLLDDFADDVLNKPPGSGIVTDAAGSTTGKEAANASAPKPDAPLDDEFKNNIEELIKDLNISDPETKDQFADLVKQFELNHREEAEAEAKKPYNFEYVMKETMERLKKSGDTVDEKIKNDPSSANPEDMLSQLLAGMGGAGEGGDMDMSKLLVDMLEQLSTKEVLYEPIKDLNSKLPDYLKEKKGVISDFQYTQYTKQYEITSEILAVFDAPGYSDDQKDKREKVNTLLESLQEMGQPPSELVGEAGEIPGLGSLGGLGGGKNDPFAFNDKDLPENFEKELEEGCKQQ